MIEGGPASGLDGAPELEAILRLRHPSKYRLSQHFCKGCGNRFAQVFQTGAGPILRGHGLLATEEGDRNRGRRIDRYLAREPLDVAAVSLQCNCTEHHLRLKYVIDQRGKVFYQPRKKPT